MKASQEVQQLLYENHWYENTTKIFILTKKNIKINKQVQMNRNIFDDRVTNAEKCCNEKT